MLKEIWSGWNHSWNAFDRLVDWYFIGETWKLYQPDQETQEVEHDWASQELTREMPTPIPDVGLDLTPVTQHLKELLIDAGLTGKSDTKFRVAFLASGSVPKDLQYPESNEDSLAWDDSRQRAAVFDGATESFAARRWVEIIRQQWLTGDPFWIRNAQVAYARDIEALNLSWAQLEAAERGSYTTLVSLEMVPSGLQITTVGDSCVFLLNANQIIGCAPYVSDGEFFASPQAISTRPQDGSDSALNSTTFILSPETLKAKHLLLATDALSQWLMIKDSQERVSRLIRALKTDELARLVTQERANGSMKTDDTTALYLEIQNGDLT
jgi:serine/threonine protein phosphatase PrpC